MIRKLQLALAGGDSTGNKLPQGFLGSRAIELRPWDWRHFLFYLGVPLVVAIYAALNNWAILQEAGYPLTLLFYFGHAFIPWWTTSIVTFATMVALSSWRPHRLLIWSIGTLVACFLVLPYSEWLTAKFAAGWLPGDASGQVTSAHIHEQVSFWQFLVRASVVWIAVNFLFDRLLGLPRYRYADAVRKDHLKAPGGLADEHSGTGNSANSEAPPPRFLDRLPETVSIADVIAVKAEQHYIKVYTTDKSFMTLYRFSDAVSELARETGQQVHRSYWIRTDAIQAIKRIKRKYSAELSTGMLVPVSAPNRGLVQQIAKSKGIPIQPPL
jgi:hypothetical protein